MPVPPNADTIPAWDAGQYLRFADERTRPCRELAARVALSSPRQVIDLGCGPGNSTQVLAERWPPADLTGLDNSTEMIDTARRSSVKSRWQVMEIGRWAETNAHPMDVVFSYAALQWVDDYGAIFPSL